MAFETGTAANLTELIDERLKNFAIAQGWTVNADNWPDHLAISRDGCFANFRFDSSVDSTIGINFSGTNNFVDAFAVARTDVHLWAHLSTGFAADPAGWAGQPGSPVDSVGIFEPFVACNDLLGPFPSYALFSGDETAGDPAYIYLVVETRSGFYTHVLFGNVNQSGLGYSPNGAFLTGTRYEWWPRATDALSRNDRNWNAPTHRFPFSSSGSDFENQLHTSPGGALPGEGVRPTGAANVISVGMIATNFQVPLFDEDAEAWPSGTEFVSTAYLNQSNIFRGPVPVSGVVPLHPIPVLTNSAVNPAIKHWLGECANMRMCSMFGLSAGQEITFGEDVWIVYPVRRQAPRGDMSALIEPSPALTNTSFQYGLAIKRVA